MRFYPSSFHEAEDKNGSYVLVFAYKDELLYEGSLRNKMVAIQFRTDHSFYVSLQHHSYELIQMFLQKISGISLDEKNQARDRFSTIKLHESIPAVKLRANTIIAKIEALKILEGYQVPVHDNDKDLTPLLKLLAEKDLSMYSWMSMDTSIPVEPMTEYAEYIGLSETLKAVTEVIPPPNFAELSIDLETDSQNHNKMPEATGSLDNAIRVACITFSHGERYEEYVLSLGPDVSEYTTLDASNAKELGILPPGIKDLKLSLKTFTNEIELILEIFRLVKQLDPDVIEGHNHLGFDIPYIIGRLQLLVMHPSNKTQYKSIKIPNISRLKSYACSLQNIEWHNSQVAIKGSCIDAPGRIWLDTLIVTSRGLFGNLPDGKLDTLARERLGMGKDPVSALDMFKVFKLTRDWKLCNNPDSPLPKDEIEKTIKLTYIQLCKKHNKRLPALQLQPTLDQINSIIMMINIMSQRGAKIKLLNPNDMKKGDILKKYLDLREKAQILITAWNVPTDKLNVEDILKILWWIIIKYCLQDTRIPTLAINLQGIIPVLRELASIFSVSINNIMMRGQVYTSTAAQYRYNHKMNSMMDFGARGGPIEPYEYEGGFVGKGEAGNKITEEGEIVIILDFASLYPTAIVAYNICYTTWVPEHMRNPYLQSGKENPEYIWKKYQRIIEYNHVIYKATLDRLLSLPVEELNKDIIKEMLLFISELDAIIAAPYEKKGELMCNVFHVPNSHTLKIHVHWFLRKSIREGVVPKMLWDKFLDRRKVKKKMELAKEEGNLAMWVTYNALQLAIKVVMNATYGAFGTKTNRLANFAAAETITFIGRTSILKCNKFIEDEGIGEVVYNDTDSAMIKIDLHKAGIGLDPKKVLEYPDKVASRINSQFPKPMSMEADGIFVAFFLYGPKMYAAIKWDKNSFDINDYTYEYVMSNVLLYVKGLQLVKRDRFKFQKEIFRDILFGVLTRESAESLVLKLEDAISIIWDLKDGFKNKKLVEQDFSYNIGITPKSAEGGNGVMAKWKDIYESRTGRKPSAGERFQLMVIVGQDVDKHTKSADKLAPIEWLIEDGKKLDVLHYILALGRDGGVADILNITYGENVVPRKCIEKWYLINLQKTNTLNGVL